MASKEPWGLKVRTLHKGDSHIEVEKIQQYLRKFGYLTDDIEVGVLDSNTSHALALFQKNCSLKETGELNDETARELERPRCGVPDVFPLVAGPECKYYRQSFTYRFLGGTTDLAGTTERQAIRSAFDTWASEIHITFTEVTSGSADFEIDWATGAHGGSGHKPFDGTGTVLAHAYFPPPCGGVYAGQMHFDEDETWSLTGGANTDLQAVALHEIGHILGLRHSSNKSAVMYKDYAKGRIALHNDDTTRIKKHYCTRSLLQIAGRVLDWKRDTGDYRLWNFNPGSSDPLPGSPVQEGNWGSIRSGHVLIPIGNFVLDWVPHDGGYRLWNFNPGSSDPLPGSPVQEGNWGSIRSGHVLIPIGNFVLDWVPHDGGYRLWNFNPGSSDPLPGSPVQEGNWGSIRC